MSKQLQERIELLEFLLQDTRDFMDRAFGRYESTIESYSNANSDLRKQLDMKNND